MTPVTFVPLDSRICEFCPLGPTPGAHDVCKRCDADARAILMRDEVFEKMGPALTLGGIDYSPCFHYMALPHFLPTADPKDA